MKRKSFWVATGLLVIPVAIFFLLKASKQNFRRLPYLGEKVEPNGIDIKDTIYYQAPVFSVTDQMGKELNSSMLTDNIIIANFFFTSCKDICPTMNYKLAEIYNKAKEWSEVKFVSFSVDPDNDSTQVLAKYAQQFKADSTIWHFCLTDKANLFKIGQGFLLPVAIEDSTIDHSQQILLIDKSRHIRGLYNGLDNNDMKRLNDELKVLLYEYHQPK
ncbi:MAG: SCO family protein [Bacteroidota bacterium]